MHVYAFQIAVALRVRPVHNMTQEPASCRVALRRLSFVVHVHNIINTTRCNT